jgi:hypothetical protein
MNWFTEARYGLFIHYGLDMLTRCAQGNGNLLLNVGPTPDGMVYQTGGLRIPNAPHPHYDPCPSDIAH